MDISAKLIAEAMGKGRDDKCEVMGLDSLASPTGCCLNTVACVCEVWQAGNSNADVMMLVTCLWCHSSVRLALDQLVYCDKVCARSTFDGTIGCLALAVDWTEGVLLDQLLIRAVSWIGFCITGMGEICLISFKSCQ